MSGSANEDYAAVGRSSLLEDMSSGQRCQSSDSLAEWRSSEQVENGTPSTSPPYWDTDEDDDIGPKPSELYGKFTWKIENFSQISKRELRSNAFEVGGYKWYILIYPQGCDVCNHLSLFLCVANHDKLLPGWSHFAQFTIAVVNKDPKKSKYSDTLHRFWKKEHDWGWKKFMELSKVLDGFIVNDILVIKAQVQVIREKTHRPFRCLDCQYRRELVRVYLSNVEQICRRYIEERRGKLSKLIEDRVRWSSFRAFWSGVDQTSRQCMSSDKADAILKVVVKHFFIEKEVTSTLVMDSLYSGLKALESQSKNNKGKEISAEIEEMPAPIVCVDKDMFILADDVLVLLERAAAEPLPPKDDKALQSQNANQNRTKEGNSGDEFNRDSIERDERRLTELGRRTVEIFVLAHIFSSRIEVAYQEAVALKRQEELIREEEASWLAEEKAKRGTADKEKRSKKKQGKQKRSGRKGKDKAKDEKSDVTVQGKSKKQSSPDDRQTEQFLMKPAETVLEKLEISEDVSDVSDNGDDVNEVLQPDLEERDACPRDWDTDTSEIPPVTEASSSEIPSEQTEMTNASVVDDSSSTCSTDSVPSVGINGQYRGKFLQANNMNGSSSRGKNKRGKVAPSRTSHAQNERYTLPSDASTEAGSSSVANDVVKNGAPDFAAVPPLKGRRRNFEQNLLEKQNEVVSVQKKSGAKNEVDLERPTKPVTTQSSSTPASPIKTVQLSLQQPARINVRDAPSNHRQNEKPVSAATRPLQTTSPTKPDLQKLTVATKLTSNQMPIVSRPSSAPLVPAPRPTAPPGPTIQTVPMLSRSVSAAGRIGTTDPLPTSHNYGPQSYRNAIIGKNTMASSSSIVPRPTSNSSSQAGTCSQTTAPVVSSTSSAAPNSMNGDRNSDRSGFEQLSAVPEAHTNESRWAENSSPLGAIGSNILHTSNIIGGTASLGFQNGNNRHSEVVSSISIRAASASAPDEFPHLDLINYLLDEDPNTEKMEESKVMQHLMNREFTFSGSSSLATDPCLSSGSYQFEAPGQYYDDALQRVFYGSGGGSFNGRRDPLSPQLDTSAYGNSHIDSMLPSQWPLADHTMNMDPAEIHGYPYQLPDYSNLSRAFNTYSMYRPSNGR